MKKSTLLFSSLFLLIIGSYIYYNNQKPSEAFAKKDSDYALETVVFTSDKKVEMEFKGMNLVAPIKELKSNTFQALLVNNVNAISIIPYAYVNIDDATVNYNNKRQWWGERVEGISASAKMAHQANMTVMLKPHLWVNHNFYTGNLDFATVKEWEHWEDEYEKYILDFALLAQQEKIELFCFGTELGNAIAKRPAYWNQLILKIKKTYNGKLTYAANWDDYDKVPFWDQLDYIGVDAYFPLSNKENPSVIELNEGWKKHLSKMEATQKKYKKKILFTEYGYRNSDFAAEAPWTENKNAINNTAQANAYESLFQTMTQQKWFIGGFAWKWYADDYHKKPTNSVDYTPQEKPALTIIKKWYH